MTEEERADRESEKNLETKEKDGKIRFINHIIGLQSGAFIFLGKMPNPNTGNIEKDTVKAKELIDLLVMLREKTKGNLDSDEDKFLNNAITQCQYSFVEVTMLGDNSNDDKKHKEKQDTVKTEEKEDESDQ